MHRGAAQRQELSQWYNDDNSISLEMCNCLDELFPSSAERMPNPADELLYKPTIAIRTTEDANMRVELFDANLWEEFLSTQNEMIVTKTGSQMSPTFRLMCSNLDPNEKYCIMMELFTLDNNRYTFNEKEWKRAGQAESKIPSGLVVHPDSPATGQHWMKNIISFHTIRLTNSCANADPVTLLIHSMHRYQPRVHFFRSADLAFLSNGQYYNTSTFAFPQTVFIAVTAYQNNELSGIKTNKNLFGSGFRPGGESKSSSDRVLPVMPRQQNDVALPLFHSEPENKLTSSDVDQLPQYQSGCASYSMVSEQPHPTGPFPIRQLETCQGQTRSSDGHPQQPKGFSQSASSSHAILDSKSQSSSDSLLERGQTSLLSFERGASANVAQADSWNYQNVYPTATQSGILPHQNFNYVAGSDRYSSGYANPATNSRFQGVVSDDYTGHGTSLTVQNLLSSSNENPHSSSFAAVATSVANVSSAQTDQRPNVLSDISTPLNLSWSYRSEFPGQNS